VKLALGTVQFGIDYGVANTRGKVSTNELRRILDLAKRDGIDTLDTAVSYGDSEQRLGQVGVGSFRIISKIPPIPAAQVDLRDFVEAALNSSLQRLKVDRLDGLLIHKSSDLLGPRGDEIYSALCAVKDSGLVNKIGISIYAPEELDKCISRYAFDLVQAPYNILDQRLEQTGWLERLKKQKTIVHTRSVFLQGLLLMKAGQRPEMFSRWSSVWNNLDAWFSEQGLTRLEGSLGMVMANSKIDRVIVGVDSYAQLSEIIAALRTKVSTRTISRFAVDDTDLIDPTSWRKI